MKIDKPCPCCESTKLEFIGTKNSILQADILIKYRYWYCEECNYRFQGNPNTQFSELYGAQYYKGAGADDLIDYEFELKFPTETIRTYEFMGVLNAVESLLSPHAEKVQKESLVWLDYGCGKGAFVNWLNTWSKHVASGFDIGFATNEGKKSGIKILDFNELQEQFYDVITAVEVLEHTDDPRATIEIIFKLLKPGGLFFYTTGNSEPFATKFLNWRCTSATDVHIGFFEPKTMNKLLFRTHFNAMPNRNYSAWSDIYKYKVLKNFGIKKRSGVERLLSSILNIRVVTKLVDLKYQLMALPAARKPISTS
jgi:SAM-dependent methyltransferase